MRLNSSISKAPSEIPEVDSKNVENSSEDSTIFLNVKQELATKKCKFLLFLSK